MERPRESILDRTRRSLPAVRSFHETLNRFFKVADDVVQHIDVLIHSRLDGYGFHKQLSVLPDQLLGPDMSADGPRLGQDSRLLCGNHNGVDPQQTSYAAHGSCPLALCPAVAPTDEYTGPPDQISCSGAQG